MYFTLAPWAFGPILFTTIQLALLKCGSYINRPITSLNELCLDKFVSGEEQIIITISESNFTLLTQRSKESHKSNNVPTSN